jgi:hypothetical protein
MRRSTQITVIAILSLLAAAAAPVAAQTTTGSLRGIVTDPDGLAMPGVTVVAASDKLVSGRQVAITGGTGVYRFPSLPPGTYSVEAQLDGFRTVRQEGVTLSLGQSLDVNLQLGAVTAEGEIIVVGDAVQVSTVSNSVASNLDATFLERQPLPRDTTQLLNTAPGINNGAAYGSANDQASAYNLDGVDVSDPASGQQWIQPNFDWIEEVQVAGLGADAEYGGFTGAVVNLVTKSGGNELQGDASLYYSGGDLSADGGDTSDTLDTDYDLSLSLGGAIRKDSIWYFVSGQFRERSVDPFFSDISDAFPGEEIPASEQLQYQRTNQRFLGKLTFQANPSNRVSVLASMDNIETDRRNVGEFVLGSGAYNQDSPNTSYNATWESLINDSNFLTVKVTGFTGANDRLPQQGGNVPGHDDFFNSGVLWDNYTWTWLEDKDRLNFDASWTVFADGLFTANDSHNFKFGVVYEDSKQDEVRTRNGGFTYVDDSYYCDSFGDYLANPECGLLSSDRGNEIDFHAEQEGWHLYAQDSWSQGNVTINYGVRYTQYTGNFSDPISAPTNGTSDVYDVDMFAPRFGLVWDVMGDGGTAVKVHYGRYYDALMAFMYDRERSGGAFTDLEFWDWDFDANEWYPVGGRPTGGADMDADISHPYVDQFVATVEHQLAEQSVVGLDYIHRENHDTIAMVNTNDDYDELIAQGNPFGGDLPFFDLLSEQEFLLTNPERAERTYDAVIARYTKRYADGWSLRASVTWADLTGNTDDVDGYEDAWEDRNGLVNNDGKLGNFSEWEVKVYGSVDLPWEIMASANYLFRSGEYWTPYARINGLWFNARTNFNLTPRGSQQLDDRHLFDLHVEKQFSLGNDMTLTVMVDVFNLFDSDTVLEVSERWGSYEYDFSSYPDQDPNEELNVFVPGSTFGAPLDTEDPREIRIGARFSF